MAINPVELRQHSRVNVDFYADWDWGPECQYYDKITSLSAGGCFLATKKALSPGQQVYLRLSTEPGGIISLKGVVRYQLRVTDASPPAGAGVEFIEVPNDTKRKLEEFLQNHR